MFKKYTVPLLIGLVTLVLWVCISMPQKRAEGQEVFAHAAELAAELHQYEVQACNSRPIHQGTAVMQKLRNRLLEHRRVFKVYLGESSSALLGSLDELSLLCDEIATATEPREVEVRFRAAGHRVTQQLAAVAKDSAQEAERSASAWLIIVAIPGHVILAMLVLKLVISLDFRWSSSQTKSS